MFDGVSMRSNGHASIDQALRDEDLQDFINNEHNDDSILSGNSTHTLILVLTKATYRIIQVCMVDIRRQPGDGDDDYNVDEDGEIDSIGNPLVDHARFTKQRT
jgi:hypothetical protein